MLGRERGESLSQVRFCKGMQGRGTTAASPWKGPSRSPKSTFFPRGSPHCCLHPAIRAQDSQGCGAGWGAQPEWPPACNQNLLTRPTAPAPPRELTASPVRLLLTGSPGGGLSSPPAPAAPPWPGIPTHHRPEGLPPTCCFLQVPPSVMLRPGLRL